MMHMRHNVKKDIIRTAQDTFKDLLYFEKYLNTNLKNPSMILNLFTIVLKSAGIYSESESLSAKLINGNIRIVKIIKKEDDSVMLKNSYEVLNIRHTDLDRIVIGFTKCKHADIADFLIKTFQ